jgi:hypothetical protein
VSLVAFSGLIVVFGVVTVVEYWLLGWLDNLGIPTVWVGALQVIGIALTLLMAFIYAAGVVSDEYQAFRQKARKNTDTGNGSND